jgi:hypothetical protein
MILEEYLKGLKLMIEQNPDMLGMELVYSCDDEGNEFRKVKYLPTLGHYYKEDGEFISVAGIEDGELDLTLNSICIN